MKNESEKVKESKNPLDALNRSEFIECLLRVAKAKFGGLNNLKLAMEALMKLMKVKLSFEIICRESDINLFRLQNLYVESTDKVYRKWQKKLKEIYDSRVTKDIAMAKCWTLDTWKKFMEECNLFNEASFSR